MNFIRTFLRYTMFFFLISIIVAGDFKTESIFLCGIISSLSSLLVILIIKVPSKIELSVPRVFLFGLSVLISIYASTFSTLHCYIKRKGKIPTAIETLPLKTHSGVYRLCICQAITLTPGTVSVKSKAGSVDVLKIKPESMDGAKNFDAILSKGGTKHKHD